MLLTPTTRLSGKTPLLLPRPTEGWASTLDLEEVDRSVHETDTDEELAQRGEVGPGSLAWNATPSAGVGSQPGGPSPPGPLGGGAGTGSADRGVAVSPEDSALLVPGGLVRPPPPPPAAAPPRRRARPFRFL